VQLDKRRVEKDFTKYRTC